MVEMDERLDAIKKMVDQGAYFMINRARQYGKTTILNLLKRRLEQEYVVLSISFEGLGMDSYASESHFCGSICKLFSRVIRKDDGKKISAGAAKSLNGFRETESSLVDLSDFISDFCAQLDYPAVLIIDEVDQASDQQVFLSFLGLLRNKYLDRDENPTFQSVILAGVYDIKNLKLKMRPETEHQYNSPWNIASDFLVDMSFSADDIAGMLKEYEQDHATGMDIGKISRLLYDYTSGYPFLVSRLCQLMDEYLPGRDENASGKFWTENGVAMAVRELLSQANPLFDDIVKKLDDFPELRKTLYAILFKGERIPYNSYHHALNVGSMFGIIKNDRGNVIVSNRIFETLIYNLFLSEEILNSKLYKAAVLEEKRFVKDGELDMETVLERFVEAFTDIYGDADQTFLEENGRRFFLLFLKPIINGTGNYYVEARTRDMRRTDVVIDYLGRQYVCELKIWHGEEYNRRGEEQLIGYLKDYHLTKGYLLSFNFNKNKTTGIRTMQFGDYRIVEAVV